MASYEIVETTAQDYLYLTRRCAMKPEEIGPAMGEAIRTVWDFMQRNAIPPAGPVLAVYYDYSEDEMEFRTGFFVTPEDAARADGPVKADKTPAVRAAHAVHTGPYPALQETYGRVMSEMEQAGHSYGKPTWEVYLNDPDTTPEAELKTEIFIALA